MVALVFIINKYQWIYQWAIAPLEGRDNKNKEGSKIVYRWLKNLTSDILIINLSIRKGCF